MHTAEIELRAEQQAIRADGGAEQQIEQLAQADQQHHHAKHRGAQALARAHRFFPQLPQGAAGAGKAHGGERVHRHHARDEALENLDVQHPAEQHRHRHRDAGQDQPAHRHGVELQGGFYWPGVFTHPPIVAAWRKKS
jgi:hypothetical protein